MPYASQERSWHVMLMVPSTHRSEVAPPVMCTERNSVFSLWGQRYCGLYATGAQVAGRASHTRQELRNGPVKDAILRSFTIAQGFIADW